MITPQGAEALRRRFGGHGPRTLDGTVVLVTGGGRGVGRLAAQAFASAGASVGLIARSADELAETVASIEAVGGTAEAAVADVTDEPSLARAVLSLRRAFGPADVLVNNAGILGPVGPTWELDLGAWWDTMNVNLRGMLSSIQLVLPDMVARRHGRVLNLASEAGTYRWPLVSAYSVSKAAVAKLTENLAHETRQYGISVFSVHPGLLPIGLFEAVMAPVPDENLYLDRIRRWAVQEMHDGRGADPEVAARMLVRLAAGDADALSGRHISVHDDLDALLENIDIVNKNDLYVLRPERLAPVAERKIA